jgi:elongation factor P
MATTNDLKNGLVLNLDGELWSVVEFQHVKPGKGGAFVRTTLKNVLSGKVVDKTFNAGTKVETGHVDKRTMQYLYATATTTSSWTWQPTTRSRCRAAPSARRSNYLLPEAEVDHRRARGRPALRRTADSVSWRSPTPSRGCRATAPPAAPSRPPWRPARPVMVPLFITNGEKIKVDTRDGRYLGRAT